MDQSLSSREGEWWGNMTSSVYTNRGRHQKCATWYYYINNTTSLNWVINDTFDVLCHPVKMYFTAHKVGRHKKHKTTTPNGNHCSILSNESHKPWIHFKKRAAFNYDILLWPLFLRCFNGTHLENCLNQMFHRLISMHLICNSCTTIVGWKACRFSEYFVKSHAAFGMETWLLCSCRRGILTGLCEMPHKCHLFILHTRVPSTICNKTWRKFCIQDTNAENSK